MLCWPGGSHLSCGMEACATKKSDIIHCLLGIRVPGGERVFGKSEHKTVVLTVGAQDNRECRAAYVLRRPFTRPYEAGPEDGPAKLEGACLLRGFT